VGTVVEELGELKAGQVPWQAGTPLEVKVDDLSQFEFRQMYFPSFT
jgi:hypothetical protein